MTESESQHQEPLPIREEAFRHYVQIAMDWASKSLQGRNGFGALREYTNILDNSCRLVLSSGFFSHRTATPGFPWGFPDPECWDFFRHFGHYKGSPGHRFFVEVMLSSPANYSPRPIWALFWSLAKAEHIFLEKYIPFWSHEERLTGHLVSLMVERLEEYGVHWRSLAGDSTGKTDCQIWYADTATARQEHLTGADLGLVVHGKMPGSDEFFKVVRFQAKKVGNSGNANIDFDQLEALLSEEHVGYYLFYYHLDKTQWSLPPTSRPASDFTYALNQVKEKHAQTPRRNGLGTHPVKAHENGYDLATMITFGVADPASEVGKLANDACDAVSILGSGPTPPSRILIVTLGSGTDVHLWQHLLREYIGFNSNE